MVRKASGEHHVKEQAGGPGAGQAQASLKVQPLKILGRVMSAQQQPELRIGRCACTLDWFKRQDLFVSGSKLLRCGKKGQSCAQGASKKPLLWHGADLFMVEGRRRFLGDLGHFLA
jgi:hypothetical protein